MACAHLTGAFEMGDPFSGSTALRMRDGDPAEDFRKLPVQPGPEKQMPMIRHEAIGGDADLGVGVGLGENLFKGGVISGCLEERESPDTTIQDVIGKVTSNKAWTAWHAGSCSEDGAVVSRNDSR